MKKIIFIIFLSIIVKCSNACDCDSIIGKEQARHVFKGKVLSVTKVESPYIQYEIMFEVKKRIKGHIKARKVKVNVDCLLSMCCGIPFKKDELYIIYTYLKNGTLYTGACTESYKVGSK